MEPITITRPVTEDDQEWIAALFPTVSIWSNPGVGLGTQRKIHVIPTLDRTTPVRTIPCHPTRPII